MKKIFIAFICVLISCTSLCEIRKSNQAAFSISKQQDVAFKNPYITDGLIAMWDGEWNIGLGIHNDKSSEWKNLVEGGVDLVLGDYGKWDYNSLLCLGGRIPAYATHGLLTSDSSKSVTVVFETISPGIVFTLGEKEENGAVTFVSSSDGYLYLSRALSAGAGIKNRIPNNQSFISVTANYQDRDVIYAEINGESKTPSYKFGGVYSTRLTVGDRYNDSSNPFTGKVFHIRVYDRVLSQEEISYNYMIDKERFGL